MIPPDGGPAEGRPGAGAGRGTTGTGGSMVQARVVEDPRAHRAAQVVGPALAILALQVVAFPMPGGVYVLGAIVGLLGALVAVGMALIYRANRILNFAQSDLGAVPTVLAAYLVAFSGLNYLLSVTLGLLAAVTLGAAVELLVIRRFFRASRLILTVATIGLSQLLTVAALLLPSVWGERPSTQQIDVPFTATFTVDPIIFNADHLVALIVAPLALVAVAVFLRSSAYGIAVRASAERADRASLLGIPVRRIQTLVWAIAALLSFVGVFLRAGIVGLPVVTSLSAGALLFALAAVMLGRLTDLPAIALSAVALGILEQGVVWNNPRSPEMVYPIVAGVILVALLVRRRGAARTEHDGASSWQTADEVRPIPRELRGVGEVRTVVWGGGIALVAAVVALPLWLGPGDTLKASAVAVFAIIALSIVVLTGWAGQVSLGQMSFAAVGGAVAGHVTSELGFDLAIALVAGGIAGALVAVVVGLPALRLRGLFLAVTTLAFALATSTWLLNGKHFGWVPRNRVERDTIFGAIDLSAQRSMYWLCVVCLGLALLAVRGIRRSRTGRVLLSQRENERGAQAFGINVTRAKLTAFALSGFLAAFAGGLLVHLQQQYSDLLFSPAESLNVFTSAVVGGLGSMTGALLGALYLQGGKWFLPANWQLLPSAVGVLVVLMVLPGGLGGLVFRVRDLWLRSVARRHGIIVPSLLADVRQDPEPLVHAEEAVEHADGAGAPVATVRRADEEADGEAVGEAVGEEARLATAVAPDPSGNGRRPSGSGTAVAGDTGDTGDTADTADTGDTADTADTGDTGDAGDAATAGAGGSP
jgi:branched-chain amino acid transport system permease protein